MKSMLDEAWRCVGSVNFGTDRAILIIETKQVLFLQSKLHLHEDSSRNLLQALRDALTSHRTLETEDLPRLLVQELSGSF